MRSSIALGAAAAVLAGCAVGADYESPLATAPAQAPFAFAGAGDLYSADEPPGEWWRLYDDPALDAAVQEALAANTDLRIAAANVARAQALLRGARSDRLPATTLTAGSTSGRQNVVGQNIRFEDTLYDVGLNVSYQLDLFGRVRRAVEASRAEVDSVSAAHHVMRITVAAETSRAYADACAAGFQVAVARNSADLQRQSYELTQRLLDAGRGTALDVARAAAQLEQTRAVIPALEADRSAALYRLAVLRGRPPTEAAPEAAQCARPLELTTTIAIGDGAALLRRRPDVREAERALAAATALVGVAVGDLYPRVTLGAFGGTTAFDSGDLGNRETTSWSLGPLISWSFPNRSAVRARIAAAEANVDAALAAFDGTWLNALRETETALSDYAKELDRRSALQAAQRHSAEAAQLANARFEAGQLSFLDVLQAELTLADADLALAQARLASLQITLFLALGGGF